MSQLTLVRHGQAAAFSDDSDRLTPLGERQARALAEHLLVGKVRFDEVYTGSLRRQIETERIVAAAYAEAGVDWPEPTADAGWNEYDSGGVSARLAPLLSARDANFARLAADFRAHAQSPDRNRYFQRMFEVLMDHWVSGTDEADGFESFAAFHARVSESRQRVLSRSGSRQVAVFTSGGPIGVCVQLALAAPPHQAMKINWRVRNGSLTEFMFSRDRLSLESFNRYPHLGDPALQSYR